MCACVPLCTLTCAEYAHTQLSTREQVRRRAVYVGKCKQGHTLKMRVNSFAAITCPSVAANAMHASCATAVVDAILATRCVPTEARSTWGRCQQHHALDVYLTVRYPMVDFPVVNDTSCRCACCRACMASMAGMPAWLERTEKVSFPGVLKKKSSTAHLAAVCDGQSRSLSRPVEMGVVEI